MGEKYVIGIDAGGTKVAYGLFDKHDKMIDRFQHPTDVNADGAAFSDKIIESIDSLLAKNGIAKENLDGIGICMPSFIIFDEGKICLTSAMVNIKDFAMRDYLGSRLGVKVVLDNDSNAAALAEHRHGSGKGHKHMVYIAASTGIGSGIIIDNRLFRGSNGFAGECGHMIITPHEGIECGCENQGCFMSYASGRYACIHAQQRVDAGEASVLVGANPITGADLLAAYHQNDRLAIEIVENMAHYLAVCVFNVYQLLNIDLFVFGGGLVNFGDALFGKMKEHFYKYKHSSQPVEFKFAALEKDFGIIGAAELAKE